MIVALDGPAASGKGTLAERLARHLGLPHLDTGLLYRAAAWHTLRAGGDPARPADAEAGARAVGPADLLGEALRTDALAAGASQMAAIPEVRARLLAFQRAFAHRPGGAVLDGRDIGTVVVPEADAKLFVTAAIEVRAQRRLQELLGRGQAATYPVVLKDLKERDERDSRRAAAPLVPAVDAYLLDTSELDAEQAFERALAFIRRTIRAG